MRPRTITVDIARGGDYALADYRRQARRQLSPAEAMLAFAAAVRALPREIRAALAREGRR